MPTENDQAANMGFVNERVRKAAPRNLLDNSDFRNPVNQRGVTTCDTNGHWIDRWIHNNVAYMDIKTGCIGINAHGNTIGGLMQILENPALYDGEKLTLAVRAKSNGGKMRLSFPYVGEIVDIQLSEEWNVYTYTVTFRTNAWNCAGVFAEPGSAIDVAWVALYEGECTADTLPEYQPKEYGAKLIECQRYLQRFRTETERKTYCEDFRPTMRMTDTGVVSTFEKEIDGVTYYFASAEL